MLQHITIPWEQEKLAAVLQFPKDSNQRLPLVIICHGFIGSKTGVNRLFVEASSLFVQKGYAVLRFDYAGCGESSGEYGKGGLDQILSQTRSAIKYASSLTEIDPKQISLLGHSLGGAVALIISKQMPDIHKLIMWAPVAHPYKDLVRIVGSHSYSDLIQTGNMDHMGYEFIPSFFHSLQQYQPLKEAISVTQDVLVVHGTADQDIPVEYCFHYDYAFRTRKKGRIDKEVITGGDHTFSSIKGREKLFTATLDWLTGVRYMRQAGHFDEDYSQSI
ncbi:alpha/beta hydrolase family protein [Brevibacillus daliensis]|uniref:alpha/beta hydrolase family protein n=1 Tax=Brevibacillus daliensis TaxID=2892995 RepID=UPI001E6175E1|nr:alpha/beta fold hydrolase [Brevibacillus daliensis]